MSALEVITAKLAGGDRRSIGRSHEVVSDVERKPALFEALIDAMDHADPLVRMRAADAVEKVTRVRHDLLAPHRSRLLRHLTSATQKEMRWHLAQVVPRLGLNARERHIAVETLLRYLTDSSSIVRTFSMQALAELATIDADLRARVLPLLVDLAETGTAAMRSRGRKLVWLLRSLDA